MGSVVGLEHEGYGRVERRRRVRVVSGWGVTSFADLLGSLLDLLHLLDRLLGLLRHLPLLLSSPDPFLGRLLGGLARLLDPDTDSRNCAPRAPRNGRTPDLTSISRDF